MLCSLSHPLVRALASVRSSTPPPSRELDLIKRLSSPRSSKGPSLAPDHFVDESVYTTPTLQNPLFSGPVEKMASLELQFEAAAAHFATIVESVADKDKLVMYALVSRGGSASGWTPTAN